MASSREFCLSAIAYLKCDPPDDGAPVVELPVGEGPVIRPFGNNLHICYLVDEGDNFKYVQYRHLRDSGVTEEELHKNAIENLTEMARRNAKVQIYGNIYAVLMGGNFEASLLLVDEFWSVWHCGLAPSGFVVAFPARDVLAFGDLSSHIAIQELNAVCERAADNKVGHPLSFKLFRRVGNSWKPRAG